MRCSMVTLGYAASGIVYTITVNMKYRLNILYYFITMSILVLNILKVFVILAKCYSLHVRENERNVLLIAEEHNERYMDQEVEYKKTWNTHLSVLANIFLLHFWTTM